MDGLRRPIALLAAAGFFGSLAWHALVLSGRELPGAVWGALFGGIFVVWLPTVLQLQRSGPPMRGGQGWRGWSFAALGAPAWMKVAAALSFVYAFGNFFLATGSAVGEVSDGDPGFTRIASGHALVFYSVAMLVMTAAANRAEEDLERCCVQGHPLAPTARSCDRCGAPARQLRTPADV